MILLAAGGLLIALGLFAGAVLVAAPLGLISASADFSLWVLFPLLCIVGFSLFAIPAKSAQIRAVSLLASGLLVLLALAAAAALVLLAASIMQTVDSPLSLWYVLITAGMLGSVGAASYGRGEASTGEER
jgi:hypothetical protein